MQQMVGKYELQKMLGKGASGTVYLALDTFSQEQVALKVLDTGIFQNTRQGRLSKSQFLNEASLTGKLAHPHIVAILDAVIGDDSGHIAMEYVPGGSLLRATHPDHLLPPGHAIEIGFKCCGALDYAARQGIIHRDIKPANILVVKGTDIKVADFGAAYLHDADTTQIVNIGSPSYMSPEQIMAQPVEQMSDMYSLGVVLFELLTGRKPFPGDLPAQVIQKILREDAPPASSLRKGLPAEIDPVLARALAKKSDERYPSWADFALELAKLGRLSVYQQDIPDSEKFRLLRAMEMLKPCNDGEIWELVHASEWTRVPGHSAILREDEPGSRLFLLAQGEVKVTKRGRLLGVLRAGECFGEMSYIKGGDAPRQATVESLTEIVVAEVGGDGAEHGVSNTCRLHLTQAVLNALVDRLALADARISHVIN